MNKFKYFFVVGLLPLSLNVNLLNNKNVENDSKYHQLYILGDSLSDTGGFTGAGTDFVNTRFMPVPFSQVQLGNPYYHNKSFCNGPVAVQHLADKLNLNLTAGWKFSAAWGWLNYNHIGNNYAVGGSVAAENSSWTGYFYSNRFSLDKQEEALFDQHQDLQANDLVVIESGSNDMLAAIGTDSSKQQLEIINKAVKEEKIVITNLIKKGMKHIAVTNVPDFGEVPEFYQTDNQQLATFLSTFYNSEWTKAISHLISEYPGVIKTYDLNSALNKYLKIFEQKGLSRKNAITSNYASLITSGTVTATYVNGANPENINDYFFLDEVHPTEWLQNQVGNDFYNLVRKW